MNKCNIANCHNIRLKKGNLLLLLILFLLCRNYPMKNHGLMEECQNIFGLILNHFGRDDGLRKLCSIISELHKLAPDLYTVRISQILKLKHSVQ